MSTETRREKRTVRRTGRAAARRVPMWACIAVCVAAAAGCGSTASEVIATRSGPPPPPAASAPDDAINGVIQRLDDTLAQANGVTDTGAVPLTPQTPEYLDLQPVLVAERMRALGALGTSLVSHRVQTLSGLRQKLGASTDLNSTQVAPLFAQIDTAIAGLNALQSKINADPYPDMLQVDIHAVLNSHALDFVYPKVQLSAASNAVLNASQKLSMEALNLRQHVDQNASKLTNPAHDQALISDLQSQAQAASASAQATLVTLNGLDVAAFPGNQGALVDAQHAIQLARLSLVNAETDSVGVHSDLGF